ncbi:MAG: hypothetical protein VX379_03710 [Pseudomonadota bacterium]|nr:hypothetical protein [Pseudomonadota bacterium]MEE3320517.1 hypothetical protein [Pseudomonadota bacterium]
MSKTDKLKEKYGDDEVVRTSLRMTAGRRRALKGLTKELGFPNQDDTIAYLVDYALDQKGNEDFIETAMAAGAKLREARMSEKQKVSEKMKKLAALPQDELDRLLAQIDK